MQTVNRENPSNTVAEKPREKMQGFYREEDMYYLTKKDIQMLRTDSSLLT